MFDIDGVLVRGKTILPAAREAMKKLCKGGKWQVPVCFMTNGGGITEDEKAQQLSQWLDAPVEAASQVS